MTYEKAAKALVDAGLLDQANARMAAAVLAWPSTNVTYPAWAKALVRAGLLTQANLKPAIVVMEKAGIADAEDDGLGFEKGLGNAGIP